MRYLKNDYVPTGNLTGFPLPIIDKMIERQVEQGNKANVEIFENQPDKHKVNGGFSWTDTCEGFEFWERVITNEDFDLFFEKYPNELSFPRVIEVRNSDENDWVKRVCIMFKNDEAICWVNAETIEESEREVQTSHWSYWREVQEEESKPELDNSWSVWSEEIENKRYCDPFDFSEGIEDYADLMGKTIIHKDGNKMLVINELFYDEVNELSSINEIETKFLFENYTFIDGSPVGVSYKGLNKIC